MRRNLVFAAMLLVGILLLPGYSPAATPSAYQVPLEVEDGWQTASPESVGLDKGTIEALVQEVQNGDYDNLHSVLVVKDGKLVLEEYLHGYNRLRAHDVASVTKSVTSILIGIAIEQGAIAGADQSLADLLPEYADLIHADPAKRDLTLWHILTMTSGFEWDEETYPYGDLRNDCTQMERSADPVRFVLERPIVHRPGTHFQYSGGNAMLLSAILKRQTGMQAHAFAKPNLFEPLGISGARWELYANGLTDTGGGLSLRARDMAKIGLLMLNGGRWNGEQVIPPSWVEESTQGHVAADAGAECGYQWWRTKVPVGLRHLDTYFAAGFGGQQINVFPELGLVVVFTDELTPGSGNAMQNLALMSEYILPAALPADASVVLLWAWPVLIGLSLLGLFWNLARYPGTASGFHRPSPLAVWLSWAWIVLIFGPLGLVAYRVSDRAAESSGTHWRHALAATLHCASGNAAGFCLLFALIMLFQPQGDLLLLALVFPLLVGWMVFRAPIFAHQTGSGYLFALRRTLLTEVITTLLVLAGTLPLIILLQVRWFPLGNFDLTDPLFWLMISLAAMAGALVVYPFNYWLARRGLMIWPARIAAQGATGPAMPSLRNAWWALLLSILLCILLIATACNASLAGGESGSITLVPFSSEEYGVRGVVPVACEQGAPGQFDCSRLRSGQSPVFLILQLNSMTMDEFMPLLVTDLSLTAVPGSRGTFRGAALTWERYHFEAPLPELGPEIFRLDLALAEHDSAEHGPIVYAVALLTLPDDYDPHRALYETVLRHVAYALAPLE